MTVRREVDWNLEMGAIARRCYETGAPAPLFDERQGRAAGLSRARRADGREPPAGARARADRARARAAGRRRRAREIVEALVAARGRPPIAPAVVDSGPCKQNVWRGDDVDLTSLPVPLLHAGDGGRYLNTLGMVITRTPDRRWTSWAVARLQLVDERRASYAIVPFQHTGRVLKEWREHGEDMPVAVAMGVPPIALYAASMPLPERWTRAATRARSWARPIETVRCESLDLEVPAESRAGARGARLARAERPRGAVRRLHGLRLAAHGARADAGLHGRRRDVPRRADLPVLLLGGARGRDAHRVGRGDRRRGRRTCCASAACR